MKDAIFIIPAKATAMTVVMMFLCLHCAGAYEGQVAGEHTPPAPDMPHLAFVIDPDYPQQAALDMMTIIAANSGEFDVAVRSDWLAAIVRHHPAPLPVREHALDLLLSLQHFPNGLIAWLVTAG